MPVNAGAEYTSAESQYHKARTLEEKIEALKEMVRTAPKHKSSEHLVADLRRRLSKLEDQLERKSRRSTARRETIKKTEDILVSIIGLTQSGKSTLLKSLTNSSAEIGYRPYTTKEPAIGVAFFEGVNIQFVEIPSFFLKFHMNIAHAADLILILARDEDDLDKLNEILKENKLENKKKMVLIGKKSKSEYSEILNRIIKESEIIRIFTKPIGKPAEKKAVVLKKGSIVKDLVQRINYMWVDNFNFVRIFDDTRFSGRKVGLEYVLKDKDIVEIHTL
jgi:ribosome-interacting GTPase 1